MAAQSNYSSTLRQLHTAQAHTGVISSKDARLRSQSVLSLKWGRPESGNMRQLALIALTSSAQLLFTNPAIAQADKFSRTFGSGIFKGCISNISNLTEADKKYCKCYSDKFTQRYSAVELRAIGQIANEIKSPKARNVIIQTFMSPEIKACRAINYPN